MYVHSAVLYLSMSLIVRWNCNQQKQSGKILSSVCPQSFRFFKNVFLWNLITQLPRKIWLNLLKERFGDSYRSIVSQFVLILFSSKTISSRRLTSTFKNKRYLVIKKYAKLAIKTSRGNKVAKHYGEFKVMLLASC